MTPEQIKALQAPLDPRHIKPPPKGKFGSYVDGFHIVTEANRIFGHDGWSYAITALEQCSRVETTDSGNKPQVRVGYRCTVRADVGGVCREGAAVGTGMAKPENEADAHESAVKEAETDALKRALRSFGYTFGLALYDKSDTNANIGTPPVELPTGPINDRTRDWLSAQIDATGCPIVEFCKAFEVPSLKAITYEEMEAVKTWLHNNKRKAA
jgi:DNA repair and recombination protein RAD52